MEEGGEGGELRGGELRGRRGEGVGEGAELSKGEGR